ncbi:MAG TPA: helix-turn-helix domain-containing protein [Cellvibrionaceae bacterium]|nr:helix-turn-helix domain-containing protein [Cellvibrionaceae bacterium]
MSKNKSRILDEVQETSEGLFAAGAITKRQLANLAQHYTLNVEELKPTQIKSLRVKAQLSQTVFAAVLNTSVSTVQKWEIGDKKPSGPSLKLLHLLQRKGLEAIL